MAKTTKTKRPANLARFQSPSLSSSPKTAKAAVKSTSTSTTKTKKLASLKRTNTPLSVSNTTDPVKFGKIGENSYIYLKEGVEKLVSDLQVSIVAKDEQKKAALESLRELEDLPSDCTMSDIRKRLNTTVSSLIDLFNAM